MRRHLALLVALAATAALVPQAHAATQRYLTLTGASSGYVDVRFPGKVSFDAARSTYQRSGAVAGFYVRAVGVPAFDESSSTIGLAAKGFTDVAALGRQGAVGPAGTTYRFYLIADRPATVRIAMTGLARNMTARVRHPARVATSYGEIPVAPDPVKYRGHRATRINGGNRVVVTGLMKRVPGHGELPHPVLWGETYGCLGPLSSTHCPSAEEPTEGLLPNDPYAESGSFQLLSPGDVAKPLLVHQHYAGTARPDSVLGLVVELTLAR